jgi:hypothetical protein
MRLLERLEVPERPPSRKDEINCELATYSAGADPQSSTAITLTAEANNKICRFR